MSSNLNFLAGIAVHILRRVEKFPGRWRVERWLAGQPRSLMLMAPRLLALTADTYILVEAFNNRDMYVQSSIRDKDELVLFVFDALLRPGDNVLDVGANIGRMTVLASKGVGPGGRVIAFEPSPLVIASLYKNIFFNQCKNVSVRNYAVADADGSLPFHVPLDTNSGLGSFRDLGTDQSLVIEVPIRQIDQERGLPDDVRLIKIDTEGADLRVLRGAELLIARCRPAIVLEFSPAWIAQMGDEPKWILEFAARHDYSLYQLQPEGPRALTELPAVQIDLLCTPRALSEPTWAALKKL
jgi:FkbM family methyltransferase